MNNRKLDGLLQGKKIVITGASSGIGRACAIFFSQQGAELLIHGRDEERLKETLTQLSCNEISHRMAIAELDSVEGCSFLMEEAQRQLGAIDGLVHCVGINKIAPLKALQEDDFDSIFSTNVKSAQFLAKNIRRKNFYNPSGTSLVFLSSVAAFCGETALSTYGASKAALQGLSRSLALELARNKIRVNCVAPGQVETEMVRQINSELPRDYLNKIIEKHPLGLGTPEDIAHTCAFLVSDYSRWITGTTVCVDGGYSAH